jgi:hypothetical protein
MLHARRAGPSGGGVQKIMQRPSYQRAALAAEYGDGARHPLSASSFPSISSGHIRL